MLNLSNIIGKFIKNSSQRELDNLKLVVEKINAWEDKIKSIPDEDFPKKTAEFRLKIKNGEEAGVSQNKKPEKAEHNPDEKKLFNKVVEVFDGEILR